MIQLFLDCLISPSHHFGGLSPGNLSSSTYAHTLSHPREAALQGLEKCRKVMEMGGIQYILPPERRAVQRFLERCGFSKKASTQEAYEKAPYLLSCAYSSSLMWMANSATFTPSCDAPDKRAHLTLANCQSTLHRAIEAQSKKTLFKTLFGKAIEVRDPLPSGGNYFLDEGSANHVRLSSSKGALHLFTYGTQSGAPPLTPYPSKHSLEASLAIARGHGIEHLSCFLEQNPSMIEKGFFHSDLMMCGYQDLLIIHEESFKDASMFTLIKEQFEALCKAPLTIHIIESRSLSVEKALSSYLFNSQIVELPSKKKCLLAPLEAKTLDLKLPLEIEYVDLKESMQNGGGPACLSLEMSLLQSEIDLLSSQFRFTRPLYERLKRVIEKDYRETLSLEELASPSFLVEYQETLEQIETCFNA